MPMYPSKDKLEDWLLMMREILSYSDIDEVVEAHEALHEVFGAEPNELLYSIERKCSDRLSSWGLPHRHKDALSDAAGTTIKEVQQPTVEEASFYLRQLTLHSGVVQLVQDIESPTSVHVSLDTTVMPKGLQSVILKQMQKQLPPGLKLKVLPKSAPSDFSKVLPVYDLVLQKVWAQPAVVPWSTLIASAPESVLKSGKPNISVRVINHRTKVAKSADGTCDHYVLGPVLFPEREDAQGHIYSHEQVQLGCHWWAEHSNKDFSISHVLQGGKPVAQGDIVLLENYIMPVDCDINGEHIPAGTWMVGAGIRNEQVWKEFQEKGLQCWSMAADVMAVEETV